MSNQGIDVDALLVHWAPYVVGKRDSITVAMDWTEFDADGQATIMLSLLSRHGWATPLVWLTVDKAALKNRRNGYEYQVLVPGRNPAAAVRVRIVADRGFGDHKLYRVLTEELKFDFVIRFRGNITVTATDGEAGAAADWVGAGGRARTLRGAAVTAQAYPVATVVCVRAKGMRELWCLTASTADEPARASINLYAKRWEIEGGFRDTKDLRFGMGLGSMHVSTPDRRDRPVRLACQSAHHRCRANGEQTSQIAVPLFGHAAELLFASARVLAWHQPYPRGQLAARLECRGVRNGGGDCRCSDWSDARNARQSPTDGVRLVLSHNHCLNSLDSLLESMQFRNQTPQRLTCQCWHIGVAGILQQVVGAEIVLHEHDLLRCGKVHIGQILGAWLIFATGCCRPAARQTLWRWGSRCRTALWSIR